MAAEIHFKILTEHGREILDELELQTEVAPYLSSEAKRAYNLTGTNLSTDAFDAMLDQIAPDWREHLSRTR